MVAFGGSYVLENLMIVSCEASGDQLENHRMKLG
jgi:hypothetical protein